jgi:alpha-tubulin suppressor-like RCC1 family protein
MRLVFALPWSGGNACGQLGLSTLQKVHQLTPIMGLQHVVALQAGEYNSAAITLEQDIYLWGRNDHGQLGLGNDHNTSKPILLRGYKAVHPDNTLRRTRKSTHRPISEPPSPKATPTTKKMAKRMARWAGVETI